ncbi:HNH endonuclease [uncultured Psychroserpens sp.]|uniref:HNH endonuclease n=1 Tax=uncultured Psychroserpens sp. TaxID=255436 RepID=UPI0026205F17|nr:HNH endonuclease [uncultured Psychroserpens sp.]
MKSLLREIFNLDSDQSLILLLVLIWIVVMTYVVFYSGKSTGSKFKPKFKSKSDVEPYSYYKHTLSRKTYYNEIYLKSEAWQRKRYVVLRRDHWKCVYCGSKATQVHHTRYAKYNIGKEPIEWLESVCRSCHEDLHD